MKAQSFLNAFGRLWPSIEAIHNEFADSFFSYQELKEALTPFCQESEESPSSIVQVLLKHHIVTTQPRNSFRYELEPQMLDFIEVLKRETRLSFVDEYVAYINHLADLSRALKETLSKGKISDFERQCRSIDRILRTLIQKLSNDTVAVEKITSNAKLASKKLSIKERYSQVLQTWDEFLSPVIKQAEPGGALDSAISLAESTLMEFSSNEVYREMLGIKAKEIGDNLLARALDLREALRREILAMQNHLIPLVKEARINTRNTQSAAKALRLISDIGINAFAKKHLKGFHKRRYHAQFGDIDDIKSVLHSVANHSPDNATINLLDNRSKSTRNTSFSFKDVVTSFKQRKSKVPDVLKNILSNNPEIETHQALTSICHIHRDPELAPTLERTTERVIYVTKTHQIEMPSYRLSEK